LELVLGQIHIDEKGNCGPTMDTNHIPAQIFGYIKGSQNKNQNQRPSRLIVRDAELLNPEKLEGTELLYTEVKAENSIDRVTAAANPRFFERVPKGAEFNLEMVLNVFDNENYLPHVYNALRLVQDDYVGGCGSRGNGQISFKIESVKVRTSEFYEGKKVESIFDIPKDLSANRNNESNGV
jgi:CRISPR-associated protein Csm3